MKIESKTDTDTEVICRIRKFRYLSNINGLSIVDSTYLEILITELLANKDFLVFDAAIDLNNFIVPFKVNSFEGVKAILNRLKVVSALLLFEKVGKHHACHYAISINTQYTECFTKPKE